MADFDVFLSHNSKDKPVVRQIVAGLRSRGINPWFDEEQLRPGLLWQDGLQEAIAASRTAAVCLGPDGYGDWEKAEIRALVQKLVKQQLPIIPVLLPGAPETFDLGIYLEQATWVDLRNGLTEEGLDRLYWGITFQQLGPTSAALLRLTAFLAPEPIPVEMFEKGSGIIEKAATLFCDETGRQPAPCPVREALAELAAYSMITQDGGRFAVHRMVQEVLRSHIPADRLRAWIEQALRIVDDSVVGDPGDVRNWPVWNLLRPHVARIVVQADEAGIAEPTSRLMNELGQLLYAKSLYDEAEPLMRRALDIDEQAFGPEHPDVAIGLNNLALLLQYTNRLAEAEPLMRRALGIAEQVLGPEHPHVANRLITLAYLLKATNRLAEAEPLVQRALAILEQALGPEHPDVAVALNNLAQLLQDTNRLAAAEPLVRRALAIDEQSFGQEHPNVARGLNNLAMLLHATNRLAEAEPLMRRALAILENTLPPGHPRTETARRNLGALLEQKGTPLSRKILLTLRAAFRYAFGRNKL